MDIWIRSKDRESLTQVSNVQYSCLNGRHYIATYYDNLKVLGEYETKWKALEVLDEIQKILSKNYYYYIDDTDGIIAERNLDTKVVYEMPKE